MSKNKSSKEKPDEHRKHLVEDQRSNLALNIVLNFGFFYRGYNQRCYFWEIVIFSRKFLLIFIGVFTEFFPKDAKATVFLVVISFYLYFQITYKPFKYDYLNRLENFSLLVCFLTGNIGILLFSEEIKPYAFLFVLLVALLNLGLVFFWGYQFITQTVAKKRVHRLWQDFLHRARRLVKNKAR